MAQNGTIRLDPQFKSEWLKALRSGGYTQMHGALVGYVGVGAERPVGLCCIGVGVAIKRKLTAQAIYDSPQLHDPDWDITPRVANEIGLDAATTARLIDLNDAQCLSFNEIADFIESVPDKTDEHAECGGR